MASEPAQRVGDLVRNADARFDHVMAQPHEILPPGPEPEAVQQALDRECGPLSGAEACPVVKAGFGLDSRSDHGAVGFVAPPPEFFVVERRNARHWHRYYGP